MQIKYLISEQIIDRYVSPDMIHPIELIQMRTSISVNIDTYTRCIGVNNYTKIFRTRKTVLNAIASLFSTLYTSNAIKKPLLRNSFTLCYICGSAAMKSE